MVREALGGSARPNGITKSMDAAKAFVFKEFDCILKVFFFFSGKAHDDVRAQCYIRNSRFDLTNAVAILG